MEFRLLKDKHVEEVSELVMNQYEEEVSCVEALPKHDFTEMIQKNIRKMLKNNLGVIALEKGDIIGFMCGYGPIKGFNGKDTGLFIPIEGHGAIKERRQEIYEKLFRQASTFWASENIFSLGIGLFAHDDKSIHQFFMTGFGSRCMDAMKVIRQEKVEKITGISYEEISLEQLDPILEMTNSLIDHLIAAPVFLPLKEKTMEKLVKEAMEDKARFIIAKYKEEIIGYIKFKDGGETFASWDPSVSNICGAYLKPEYRGKGIYTNLLHYTLNIMNMEGKKRCGVDCETINPQALRLWSRHFTPYTYSLTRRLDERSIMTEHQVMK